MATTNTKHSALRFKAEIHDKLKYIAWHERESFAAILEQAHALIIANFEKENGTITEDQIKQSQKKK
jgi:hypothetical protein